MTREKAIKMFKEIRDALSISISQNTYSNSKAVLDELCEVAIESLSAEPTELKQNFGLVGVEVVRCKDCKYCKDYGTHRALECTCESIDMDIHPADFCSRGERREQ